MKSQTDLLSQINALPYAPGVYLMKNSAAEILYIGKALLLRKRVRSYLRPHLDMPKISVLMSQVYTIDYIETPTEVDALLLESRLSESISLNSIKNSKTIKVFRF